MTKNKTPIPGLCARIMALLALCCCATAIAGPNVPSGDMALRHDIQRLANYGIIKGTIRTWPLAWGPILRDIRDADTLSLPPDVADALERVKRRASWETRSNELTFNASVGAAEKPTRIRGFEDTPRGEADVSVGANWTGSWLSADVNVQYVDSDFDDDEIRYDDSLLAVVVGNWTIGASTQQRWWGPAWDGSVILSNNARPVPSLVLDRNFTDAFRTKWLSWLGPWDFSMLFGQLEKERAVPNAQLFGMRFNFRPIPNLEIGLSRTAQWCGDDRPCNLETFKNLLIGRDNRRSDGITEENEPGNQLAGVDFHWTPKMLDSSLGFYGQFIGEDEAGGLPSRYMGQLGLEWSGYLRERWSTRLFTEYTATICQFYESSKLYNCAYRHTIYTTGYRYRGRAIGSGADDDAQIVTAGVVLVDADETQWRALLRFGELNGGGAPDPTSTLTPTPQDIASIDISHSRSFPLGVFAVGAGYEKIDDSVSGQTTDDARFYVQWRSAY